MDLRQSLPWVPVIWDMSAGEPAVTNGSIEGFSGPRVELLRTGRGAEAGWLRGPLTADRRGLPLPGVFSYVGEGTSGTSHTGGILSGDGV